jgi:glycosyltransferase involved in cell wall biosynthesis
MDTHAHTIVSPVGRSFFPLARERRNLSSPRVSVVVPARNESANLAPVFARLPEDVYEVILVDGHSTDDTVAVAQRLRPDIRVIHQTRRGKGNALALGLSAATGDILVTLDADGSADPAEIPRFVAALVAGADLVKGSRFAQGGGTSDITFTRRIGNSVLCGLVNRIYGTRYTDLCYGYNAFWADCLGLLQSLWPWSGILEDHESPLGPGFETETVINVRAAKAALTVWEVPSYECRRIHGESNLNAIRDGLRVLHTIWRESPWRYARFVKLLAAPDRSTSGLLPTATGRAPQPVPSTRPWHVHPAELPNTAISQSQQPITVPLTIMRDDHNNTTNGTTAPPQTFQK